MTVQLDPLARWDRKTKFVEPSSRYVKGLYSLNQLGAGQLLNEGRVPLNNWEAHFLQGVLYRPSPLGELACARLTMLERRLPGMVAA